MRRAGSLPRTRRLADKAAFNAVFAAGRRSSGQAFTALHYLNDIAEVRLGIACGKKAIAKAYRRNGMKRLIRESFRVFTWGPQGIDIVIVVKPLARRHGSGELRGELLHHWQAALDYQNRLPRPPSLHRAGKHRG